MSHSASTAVGHERESTVETGGLVAASPGVGSAGRRDAQAGSGGAA